LLATVWSVWSTKTWLARTVEVEGVVIELVRMRDSDDKGYLFSPVVRFERADGRSQEFQSGLRTNPPAYYAGQAVTVVYDPRAPDSAVIRGVLSLWLTSIILGFIATVFVAVGTAMIAMSNYAARVLDQPPHLTNVVSQAGPQRSAAGWTRS
jgi:hypothetical protein